MANSVLAFSNQTYHGGHKAVFGPVKNIQEIYGARTEFRSMVRVLGPSKLSTPEYEKKVEGILQEIKAEIIAYRNRVEIQNGVTNAGCDKILSEVFYGEMPLSGVVSWMLPRVKLTMTDGSVHVITSDQYSAKKAGIREIFPGRSLFVDGIMPASGLHFEGLESQRIPFQGGVVSKMHVRPEGEGFTPLDRQVIFGFSWDTAYEVYRPGLAIVVVLGGGDISYHEAITSHTLGKRVVCIERGLLPDEVKPGVPSASVKLLEKRIGTECSPREIGLQIIDAFENGE